MKVLLLSALAIEPDLGSAASATLEMTLREGGAEVETVDVVAADVVPCTGCGSCGLKTPGSCVVHDGMQKIFRQIVASDLLVLATPVGFGSYCAQMKKVIDRFQPLMMPIYVIREGEMHFAARYQAFPPVLGVGLVPPGDTAQEDAFQFLVGRLAINADTLGGAVTLTGEEAPSVVRAALERELASFQAARP